MLRSTRPLLKLQARGLPRAAASVAPFATYQTRDHAPSTRPSGKLVPLVQRASYAVENRRDTRLEKKLAQKKLESNPQMVTEVSSVRPSYEGPEMRPSDPDATSALKKDLGTLKDTFSLAEVPSEPLRLGLAGTLPYLGTSLATTYLSWDLNTEWPSQSQFVNHFLISHETAGHYLHLLEPIQVGYGAVIISFLGAIHWGLEYAEKQPDKTRANFRYGLGVLASVLAWPTVVMPVQYALTAQFGAFVFMYFADARAATRGWAPTWYGTYRFVLTAIVGLSIFISLVGREKVGSDQPRLTGLREKFHKEQPDPLEMKKYEEMEAVELEKNRKKKAAEERRKAAEEEIRKLEEEKSKAEGDKKKADEEKPKKGKGKGDGQKKPEGNEAQGKEGPKDGNKKDGGGDDSKGGGKKKEGGGDKKDDGSE